MRDLVSAAIAMARNGKERFDIFQFVKAAAGKIGKIDVSGDENGFEIRLKATGQLIRFGRDGYSYCSR